MPKSSNNNLAWVEGDLRLTGLDSRMMKLLEAIEQSGSINQAAKQMGLSYKGAWQIIERANHCSPKELVVTAIGGNRGGGTRLSDAGKLLLNLFRQLEQKHCEFIKQLNDSLTENADTFLLLQRLAIKSSASNQIFGRIVRIIVGAVNAEVIVELKGGSRIITTMSLELIHKLGLKFGLEAVLLIDSFDITLIVDVGSTRISARNQLVGKLLRIHQGDVNAEVIVLIPGGELLTATITEQSLHNMKLTTGMLVTMIFKTNAPILGIITK